MSDMLKVGDKVLWRGGFGTNAPREAVVARIEAGCQGKYGYMVPEVSWDEVRAGGVVVDLKEGPWAYGDQLEPLDAR